MGVWSLFVGDRWKVKRSHGSETCSTLLFYSDQDTIYHMLRFDTSIMAKHDGRVARVA